MFNTQKNNSLNNCIIKYKCDKLICFLIVIIWLIIIFYDLYFGYTDNSCINEPAKKFDINIKYYLLVSGWTNISFISILIILFYGYIVIGNIKIFKFVDKCNFFMFSTGVVITLNSFMIIFLLLWNILGVIIFFVLVDTIKCDKNIYNYIFASLLIKFILNYLNFKIIKNII